MSGTPEEEDLLAAEYVLGTLDAAVARDVAARAQREPAMAASVAWWETRLAPLAVLAPPVTPPPELWDRLATSIRPATGPRLATSGPGAPRVRTPVMRSLNFWRAGTAAGFALAAAFAAVAWLRPPPPPFAGQVAALVPANGMPAAFVAETRPDGTLRLIPLGPVNVVAGRSLELWALPPGATRPVSLGLVPNTGSNVSPAPPAAGGTQLMVSLEPQGGSPTGLPTGPVLWAGTLRGQD